MNDQKNTILAIVLSAIVLIAWQYFIGMPQMNKEKQIQEQQQQQKVGPKPQAGQPSQPSAVPAPTSQGAPGAPASVEQKTPGVAGATVTRDQAINRPHINIATPSLTGSISLKGGRIDDLRLLKFRETVDPGSPAIVLLSPSGSPEPFYAEFGWVADAAAKTKVPTAETTWTQQGSGTLGVTTPVTLTFDNGEGLEFRRIISVDDKFLFTIKDEVANKTSSPVTLHPYALISRHGTPVTQGYYILHEGLIGYLGEQGEQTQTYKQAEDKKSTAFDVTNAWLGITDKYWAAALLPDTTAKVRARFSSGMLGSEKTYQTDYLLDPVSVAPGATGAANARLFAGAKEVATVGINFPIGSVGGYNKELNLNHFDLLIDWGWFYFITKPMFLAMDFFFHLFGNFGLAILMVTVLVKIIFFPLANKSYASMAKMKAVQPQMQALRERYPDDKVRQQQELMALYKNEKINPLAGCLPIMIQIPVFFALYKVLFVTIEM
ncbi:MAG: membrane protein insertase YidC, partial [Pseudolabrys sp.]